MTDTAGSLSQHENELLKVAQKEIEETNINQLKNSPIQKIIQLVRAFIESTSSICYGGTAVNNLLPTHARFYKAGEIPDYDFYHYDALNMAKRLADILYMHGYVAVAKAGVHTNTYKVFANFIPVADITQLDRPLYDKLLSRSIRKRGIRYADPNFLRMAMYLELSHPKGDISRWDKVHTRLSLLNQYYPMKDSPKTCMLKNIVSKDNEHQIFKTAFDTCQSHDGVFFGGIAVRAIANSEDIIRESLTEIDVLCANAQRLANDIRNRIRALSFLSKIDVSQTHVPAEGEIVPEHYEIAVQGRTIARVYQTIACHNYNVLTISRNLTVRIATIDTMMNLLLAMTYTHEAESRQNHILCMAKIVFEYHQKNRLATNGLARRFVGTCIGEQDTLMSNLKNKYDIFMKMKTDPELKSQYDKYFLNYNPSISVSSTRPARKTRRGNPLKKKRGENTRKSSRTGPTPNIASYLKKLRANV